MVKGTSRRVIVVESPDPKLFEQAIFIVKNDAFSQEGITSSQLVGEACRIARGYTGEPTKKSLWKRVPPWAWATAALMGSVGVYSIFLH